MYGQNVEYFNDTPGGSQSNR